MGALQQVADTEIKEFSFDLKLNQVAHAIRFIQECCDNKYPFLKNQNHYFDKTGNGDFTLSKANCFKFVGEVFGNISQAVLIAESQQIPNKFDLFITKQEFELRNYPVNYSFYLQQVSKVSNYLVEGCQPIFPDEVVNQICSKEVSEITESRIDLEKIGEQQIHQILDAVNYFCRLMNLLNSIQFLFIASVALSVNRGFAVLVSEFSKLETSELQKFGIKEEQYKDLFLFSTNLMRFFNRLFSVFLLDHENTSKIHLYMKNFRSIG